MALVEEASKTEEDPWEDAPSRLQKGIVRVNCLDCLNRTNMAQTVLALQSGYISGFLVNFGALTVHATLTIMDAAELRARLQAHGAQARRGALEHVARGRAPRGAGRRLLLSPRARGVRAGRSCAGRSGSRSCVRCPSQPSAPWAGCRAPPPLDRTAAPRL